MPSFESFDGTKLSYDTEGSGPDIVAVHGIITDGFIQFIRPGVVAALTKAGFRVTVLDQRGHGMSAKPHEPEAYADDALLRDVRALLDHLGVERCGMLGFSLGAMITLRLLPDEPRIAAAVLAGIGGNTVVRAEGGNSALADAIEADDGDAIAHPIAKQFHDFAKLVRADTTAVAAALRGFTRPDGVPDGIDVPVLVLTGDTDPIAGDPTALAEKIPGATSAVVGGTHLNVVNNAEFKQAVVSFFEEAL